MEELQVVRNGFSNVQRRLKIARALAPLLANNNNNNGGNDDDGTRKLQKLWQVNFFAFASAIEHCVSQMVGAEVRPPEMVQHATFVAQVGGNTTTTSDDTGDPNKKFKHDYGEDDDDDYVENNLIGMKSKLRELFPNAKRKARKSSRRK